MLNELVWTTGEGSRFSARTVAVVSSSRVADLKSGGKGTRPLLFAVLADAGAARPIAACVRLRGELQVGTDRGGGYELMRSLGYRHSAQHVLGGKGTILQWVLPGYFELDPGARAGGAGEDADGGGNDDAPGTGGATGFVVMPSAADLTREVATRDRAEVIDTVEWLLRDTSVLSGGDSVNRYDRDEGRFALPGPKASPHERATRPAARAALEDAVAWAPLFAAYVDRRVTSPLLRDLRFQCLLLCTLIELGSASWAPERGGWGGWGHVHAWRTEDYVCKGVGDLGWASPLFVAPKGPGLLDALVVECVRGFEAAQRGGKSAHVDAVITSRREYAAQQAARRQAAPRSTAALCVRRTARSW